MLLIDVIQISVWMLTLIPSTLPRGVQNVRIYRDWIRTNVDCTSLTNSDAEYGNVRSLLCPPAYGLIIDACDVPLTYFEQILFCVKDSKRLVIESTDHPSFELLLKHVTPVSRHIFLFRCLSWDLQPQTLPPSNAQLETFAVMVTVDDQPLDVAIVPYPVQTLTRLWNLIKDYKNLARKIVRLNVERLAKTNYSIIVPGDVEEVFLYMRYDATTENESQHFESYEWLNIRRYIDLLGEQANVYLDAPEPFRQMFIDHSTTRSTTRITSTSDSSANKGRPYVVLMISFLIRMFRIN